LDLPIHLILWEASEAKKTLSEAENLARNIIQLGVDRESVLIAVGGGVTTDMGGFLASTLLRGIRWGAIPTTLLGMADAALGGKTAVNLPEGKNLVGTFHHPLFVICDVNTLATLPARELTSGLGEVVKTAFLSGEDSFRQLEEATPSELRQPGDSLLTAVSEAGRTKMRVVEEDPEEHGVRKLLNFGHTFGHALETAAGHGNLAHGEAVALGLRCAVRMATDLEIAQSGVAARLRSLCAKLGFPNEYPGTLPGIQELCTLLSRDKKVHAGNLDLILPVEPGKCLLLRGVETQAAAEVIHKEL
jgi:3-dehydroquinate synthase